MNSSQQLAEDSVTSPEELFEEESSAEPFVPDMPTCMALVKSIAVRVARTLPSNANLDDLISAGNAGLAFSIANFIPTKGVSFRTYASHRIQGAMLDHLRAMDSASREVRGRQRELRRAQETLICRLGREPDVVELAHELGISLSEIHQLKAEIYCHIPVDLFPASSEETVPDVERGVLEKVASKDLDPLASFLRAEKHQLVANAIEELPERLKLVLALRYQEDLSLREIAEILDVVESRVSQMHSEAVRRLGEKLRGSKNEAVLARPSRDRRPS